METRRKTVGQHIKDTRRAMKIRSQRALAEKIGVHETSVANAETGSDRIGEFVYAAIENGLGWPKRSIEDYIEGKTEDLPTAASITPAASPSEGAISAARRRLIEMSDEDIAARIAEVAELQGAKAAGELLRSILDIRAEARHRT